MKKQIAITLLFASLSASATCWVPTQTGNPYVDQQAQAQFYACLQQEQYQQQMLQQQQQMIEEQRRQAQQQQEYQQQQQQQQQQQFFQFRER